MADIEKVIKGLPCLMGEEIYCETCPYSDEHGFGSGNGKCKKECASDALSLLKEQEKEMKALRLLVEWAEECDFGYDNFLDEYNRYKDELGDMSYIDGMIHIAKRTLEDKMV